MVVWNQTSSISEVCLYFSVCTFISIHAANTQKSANLNQEPEISSLLTLMDNRNPPKISELKSDNSNGVLGSLLKYCIAVVLTWGDFAIQRTSGNYTPAGRGNATGQRQGMLLNILQ